MVDIRAVEVPIIVESSLRDKGLNERVIAPRMHLMSINTSDSWTSENACSRI